MAAALRTFVYGSETVGLDSLRAAGSRFEVSRFVSRQSVISGASRPLALNSVASADQAAARAYEDASSTLMMWARLDRDRTDLVLWDLSDERFGVECCGNDVYRTSTPDYAAFADQLSNVEGRRHIPFGTDEHFELFQTAAARFVALLNAVGLGSRTLVLAPEFAVQVEGDSSLVSELDGDSMNALWRRYWKYLFDVCGLPLIVLPSTSTKADSQHRWGVAPFHFAAETYDRLAESIVTFSGCATDSRRAGRRPVVAESFRHVPLVSIESFAASPLTDGVFRIHANGVDIHVLVNIHGRRDVDRIPVFFSGALSPGQEVAGPIFSGRELCRSLDIPLISIADPSIGLRPRTELTWYAGSDQQDVQLAVATVLAGLRAKAKTALLLVGGSGGGFAALEQLTRVSSESDIAALVWNPQLDLSGYGVAAVDKFLATCYPSIYLEFGSGNLLLALEAIRERFDVNFELYSAARHGRLKNVLLLQQRDDWHFDQFMPQLGECIGVEIPNDGAWEGVNDFAGFSGRWGSGHVPPPRELLEELIQEATVSGRSMASLAQGIQT